MAPSTTTIASLVFAAIGAFAMIFLAAKAALDIYRKYIRPPRPPSPPRPSSPEDPEDPEDYQPEWLEPVLVELRALTQAVVQLNARTNYGGEASTDAADDAV
ncbi:hypothetical protein A9Z42_0033690 [Trichoderma parareesei]|uniref:Uncharacterized protein n=1 Tax=Trichoderma parareesei TaxID=858221 RepID=A0A2H2Z3Z4_TRIPA|nr:hypothetical protein A9Z42_0033690 [Trichoderma parareesei]